MASTSSQEEVNDSQNEEYCIIEASVVTGFEESARGEAREKFGTDVKAARGRISWRVPFSRVKDVIKMGSIDNCRVVVHSVPYFKFTDQFDSLARLQQMILDIDWAPGLKVWQHIYNFPHPIPPKPDVIPNAEELVDVVIATRRQSSETKESKKSRKGGRGKKKEKRKGKGGGKEGQNNSTGSSELEAKDSADAERLEGSSGDREENLSNTLKEDDQCSESCMDGREDSRTVGDETFGEFHTGSGPTETGSTDNTEDKNGNLQNREPPGINYEPKTVIIKQRGGIEPKIDIRVLPEPTVFPAEVRDNEERNLEPMDVDMSSLSINISTTSFVDAEGSSNTDTGEKFLDAISSTVPEEQSDRSSAGKKSLSDISEVEQVKEVPADSEKAGEDMGTPGKVPVDQQAQVSKGNGNPPSLGHNLSAAEFATTIIKRLTSPPESPMKKPISGSKSPKSTNCVTPPPTPVAYVGNPFSPGLVVSTENSPSAPDCVGQDITGSSVDPPCYSILPTPVCASTKSPEADAISLSKPATGVPAKSSPESIASSQGSPNRMQAIEECSSEEKVEAAAKKSPTKKERDPTKPTFRVTCNRIGDSHPFDSSSAAASFGSAVITYFKWSVDLKNFDIEVLLNIDNEEVTVSLALTKSSLHNRNLVAFGPTTLRATICYNMLRLCHIKNGDFVCDPMCGTSAIPIEGALNWQNCYHFGGDFHEKAIERTVQNIAAVQAKLKEENKNSVKIDAVQWNIQQFPLRDECVDVFISDLPFGHRMGSRTINRTLYPCLLSEMARTARSGARACLLTEDKTSLIKAIQSMSKYWQRRLVLSINIGGLAGFVFLLTRTTSAMAPPLGSWHEGKAQTSPDSENQTSEAKDNRDPPGNSESQKSDSAVEDSFPTE